MNAGNQGPEQNSAQQGAESQFARLTTRTQASLENDQASATPPENWPSIVGYEILKEIGRGGMGVVYKARQVSLNRIVALKAILPGAAASPTDLARFRTEAEAVARLTHPNIVQIYDMGEQDRRPYFSMEYVEGGSLAQRLDGTPWSPGQAAELVEVIARAMHFAHEHGIVHRDLKPGNVLVAVDGTAKVSDFGLAKVPGDGLGMTCSWAILGTPYYMSPEQSEGRSKNVGPAADIFSIGVILYQLLTGHLPFQGYTQHKLPSDVEAICLKCLQKDPRDRYATAQELADALRSVRVGGQAADKKSSRMGGWRQVMRVFSFWSW